MEKMEISVHKSRVNQLGELYVKEKNLEISDAEFEKLSYYDCAEIWRLYIWSRTSDEKKKEETPEERKKTTAKLEKLGENICKKLMTAEDIYCVFNKNTGEPHLFSETIGREDGSFVCTPPSILIAPGEYEDIIMSYLETPAKYEFKRIENGADKKGIFNFIGSALYLNGAVDVAIVSLKTVIGGQMLVPKPNYSKMPLQNIPITNPNLMRWMLLLGQMGKPTDKDSELVYRFYYRFMAIEMTKAKFLVPVRQDEAFKEEQGSKVFIDQDTKVEFPTIPGKDNRPAVCMFTDWKQMRDVYGDEWGGMVHTVNSMIELFDCAINPTHHPLAGVYVGKQTFEDMKKFAADVVGK